jgi:hypothetical protein
MRAFSPDRPFERSHPRRIHSRSGRGSLPHYGLRSASCRASINCIPRSVGMTINFPAAPSTNTRPAPHIRSIVASNVSQPIWTLRASSVLPYRGRSPSLDLLKRFLRPPQGFGSVYRRIPGDVCFQHRGTTARGEISDYQAEIEVIHGYS